MIEQSPAELLAAHLKTRADAVVAMHRPTEDADCVIDAFLATDEWEVDPDQPTEFLHGKRIRYLRRKP